MNRTGLAWLGALAGLLIGIAIVAVHFYLKPAFDQSPDPVRLVATVWKPVWGTHTLPDGRTYADMHWVPEQRESNLGFPIKPWTELAERLGRAGRIDEILALVQSANDDAVRAELITALVPDLDGYVHVQVQNVWHKQPPPKLNAEELKVKREKFSEYLTKYLDNVPAGTDETSNGEPAPAAPAEPEPPARPAPPSDAGDKATAGKVDEPKGTGKSAKKDASGNANAPAGTNSGTDSGLDFRINEAENYYHYVDMLLKQTHKIALPSSRSKAFAITANSLFDVGLHKKAAEVLQLAQNAVKESDTSVWTWLLPIVFAIFGFIATKLTSPFLEALGNRIGSEIALNAGATGVHGVLNQK